MTNDARNLGQRLRALGTQAQYDDQVMAHTGKKLGTNQWVMRDGAMTENEIYVRINGLDGQVQVVRNVRVSGLVPNVPVILKPIYPGSREYKIVDVEVVQLSEGFGNGASSVAIPSVSGDALGAAGALTVTSPMIRPFKMVLGPSGGLNVQIYGGWHSFGLWVTGEIDLTSYRPSTAGKQAWVLVYVDPVTNTAGAVTGDEYDQGSELHFSILADIAVPAGVIPIGGVVLTDTQTTIESNLKIQDRRDWAEPPYDYDAIHDNVAGEIAALTEKATPVNADLLIIEDSADTNSKKYIQIGNLPGGTDADAIHDNVAAEISAIAAKTAVVDGDWLLIEDSEDVTTDAKKATTIGALFDRAIVINNSGADVDFQIKSDTDDNAFYLDGTDGQVGFGTNTPAASIDINKDSTSTSPTVYPSLSIRNTSTVTSSLAGLTVLGNNGSVQGIMQADGLGTGNFVSGSDVGVAIGTATNHPLVFSINITERARFDTSGNFVIGGTTAAARLHVNGASTATNSFSVTPSVLVDTYIGIEGTDPKIMWSDDALTNDPQWEWQLVSSNSNFRLNYVDDAPTVMANVIAVTTGGAVGIGTGSPSGLQINTSVSTTARSVDNIRIGVDGGIPRIIFEDSGNQQWDMNNTGGDFRLGETGVANRITIKAAGGIGMNTTAPNASAALDISSTTGALLIPRMTTTQKNGITAANGDIVYDTTLNKFQGFENGSWTSFI